MSTRRSLSAVQIVSFFTIPGFADLTDLGIVHSEAEANSTEYIGNSEIASAADAEEAQIRKLAPSPHAERYGHIHPAVLDLAHRGWLSIVHLNALLPPELLLDAQISQSVRLSPDLSLDIGPMRVHMLPPTLELFQTAWSIYCELFVTGPGNDFGHMSLFALNNYCLWLARAATRHTWFSLMSHLVEVVHPQMKSPPETFLTWMSSLDDEDPHSTLQPLPAYLGNRRRRVPVPDRETCNKYQIGGCRTPTCQRAHLCERCFGEHEGRHCKDDESH